MWLLQAHHLLVSATPVDLTAASEGRAAAACHLLARYDRARRQVGPRLSAHDEDNARQSADGRTPWALGREGKRPDHMCACGEALEWANRAEIGRLQWHMLQCTLSHKTKVRREWHSAVRKALEDSTDNALVVSAAIAFWSASDRGVIHTAVEDQAIGWQAPTTRMIGNDGKWAFAANGSPPTFDRREY